MRLPFPGFPRLCVSLHLAATVCGLLLAGPSAAQKVVYGDYAAYNANRGISLSRFERAAREQGRSDWPAPPEKTGTRILVRVEPREASIAVVAPHAFGRDRLLQATRPVADSAGLPVREYRAYEGVKTICVQIVQAVPRSGLRARYSLDLAALARALDRSPLPRPVVLAVDEWRGTRAVVGSGSRQRPVDKDIWFAGLSEVRPGDEFHYECAPSTKALPGALLFLSMPIWMALFPWLIAWKLRRRKERPPMDPAEVQRRYDKRPSSLLLLPLVLPLILLPTGLLIAALVIPGPDAMFGLMDLLLPFPPIYVTNAGLFALPVSFGTCWLVGRRRDRRVDTGPAEDPVLREEDPTTVMARSMFLLFVPIILLLAVIMSSLPLLIRHPPSPWLRAHIHTLFGFLKVLPFAAIVLGFWLSARSMRKPLRSGPWYDLVQEVAERAGVRVKSVIVLPIPQPNAFATLFGTVGVTQGLLKKMEPEEVRAVVAHEIGHLKKHHTWRNALPAFALYVALWCGLRFYFMPAAERWWGDSPMLMLPAVVFIIIAILLHSALFGPAQRRREREADACAVEWTGDPELVIRALTHLHTAAEHPYRLKRSDEAMNTHPSLVHRIEAIRRAVACVAAEDENAARAR